MQGQYKGDLPACPPEGGPPGRVARQNMARWWNWQTRGTQNPVLARECGFNSHPRHQFNGRGRHGDWEQSHESSTLSSPTNKSNMSPQYNVTIEVQPKPGISSPVVATVNRALPQAFPHYFSKEPQFDPPEITVFGRVVNLVIEADSEEAVLDQIETMKREPVISNPVIEDATVLDIAEII